MGNAFVKVYNLIQRSFAYTTQTDNQGKYIPYFQTDNFPVELNTLVQGSPTATACLSTLTDFIAGEGFNLGESLETLKLNEQGLNFAQFHLYCSDSMAHEWGVASIVKFNAAGKITQVFDIPFGYCRLGIPDDRGIISKIKYNPYFGTSLYRHKDTVEYDVYNPAAAPVQAAKDKKWPGQIFWMGIKTRKHPFYPIPDYYSAKSWMNIEKNSGEYFDNNLENGFIQPTIMKIFGDPNEPSGEKNSDSPDEKILTNAQILDRELTKDLGQGVKNSHKIMTFWGNNKEEFPTIEAFPTNNNSDMYRVQDEHAIKKITIATKVPAILANISEGVSLGGDGNTIRAAVKLMQQRVVRVQNMLLGYYSEILKNLAVNPVTEPIRITAYHPFPELETIDPQAWEVLTTEEKRKWVEDHTEIELIAQNTDANAVPSPTLPESKSPIALHFNSYPVEAKKKVKKAMEWQVKMSKNCQTPIGIELSRKIVDGIPLGPREIRKLSNYLSKNVLDKDKPYSESCAAVLFDAWGGTEMMKWANDKVKELRGDE
jgi:hypothetical protein